MDGLRHVYEIDGHRIYAESVDDLVGAIEAIRDSEHHWFDAAVAANVDLADRVRELENALAEYRNADTPNVSQLRAERDAAIAARDQEARDFEEYRQRHPR